MQYERAIKQFGTDHTHVLAECEQWVDHEVVADITCTSEAAQLQAEEVKVKSAWDVGEHPKKQGWANTAGLSIAEASTYRAKKVLKVCAYCTK